MKTKKILRVVISAFLLLILLKFINIESLFQSLKQAKIIFLIPITILIIMFLLVRALVFEKIVNKETKKISYKEAFNLNLITVALNIFLPANTGGIARSYFGYKHTGLKEEMLSSSIVDLLLVSSAIFLLGIFFSWIFSFYYTLIFIILFSTLFIFILKPTFIPWNTFNKLIKYFTNIELNKNKLIESFTIKNTLKLKLYFLSIIGWIINYYSFYLICKMFSIEISPFYIFTISPLITLARIFPFTLSGLGSKEAVVVYFFSLVNIEPALALLASLTHFILYALPGLFAIPLFYKKYPEFKSKKVKLATEKDKEIWDNFVKKHNGTIYQSFTWFNIIKESHNYKPYYFYIEDRAILPTFLVKSKFFGNKLISVPHGDETGPLGDKESIKEILNEINNNQQSLNIDQIEIHNLNIGNNSFQKPFEHITFLINIAKPRKEIFQSFTKNVRNTINKTIHDNINIEIIKNEKKLKKFYYLYQKNMHFLGTPPLSFRLFQNIYKEKISEYYLAEYNNKYIAGSVFLIDNKTARWLFSVTDPKFRNLNPTTLIIWKFIEKHHKKLKTLDLGVSRPDSGNFDFKKRWNAKQEQRNWRYRSYNKKLIIDPRTDKFKTYTKIWKIMPKFIANIIGPIIRRAMGR